MNKFKHLPTPTPSESIVFEQPEEPVYSSDAEIKSLEDALKEVLKSNTLVEAKEIAASALDVDVEDYLVQEIDEVMDEGYGEDTQEELDFDPDEDFKRAFNRWE